MDLRNHQDEGQTVWECPQCHEHSVLYDYIQGLQVCESCGRVIHDEELVPQLFQGGTRPTGVIVGQKDSGMEASARVLHGTLLGRTLQRARTKAPIVKLRQRLVEMANKLSLPQEVTMQAEQYLEDLASIIGGAWGENEAAAAIYIAVRQSGSPLTLLDLSAATHVDIYALGRLYRMAIETLGVTPPPIQPVNLLSRALHRVLNGRVANIRGVEEDATLVLQWVDHHIPLGSRHPIVSVGLALMIALEMNNVSVNFDQMTSALHIGYHGLHRRLTQVREKLLSYATLLPYGNKLSQKNVASHARTIMRLTQVLGSSANVTIEGAETNQQARHMVARATGATKPVGRERDPVKKPSKRRKVHFDIGEPKLAAARKTKKTVAIALIPGESLDKEDLHVRDHEPSESEDLSDTELDAYLRTPAEVEIMKEVWDAAQE